jgi:hypothetical protein
MTTNTKGSSKIFFLIVGSSVTGWIASLKKINEKWIGLDHP